MPPQEVPTTESDKVVMLPLNSEERAFIERRIVEYLSVLSSNVRDTRASNELKAQLRAEQGMCLELLIRLEPATLKSAPPKEPTA